jgi:Ca2+-binding EF-hand superfamily protein
MFRTADRHHTGRLVPMQVLVLLQRMGVRVQYTEVLSSFGLFDQTGEVELERFATFYATLWERAFF